jgi:hypothetical protein
MSISEEEFLFLFGWDGFFASHMPDYASRGLLPGRIICEEKNLYRVQMCIGAIWASASGKNHENGLEMQFSDIEDLIAKCHFTDCRHQTEPACAIKESLAKEFLTEVRWKSYQKLGAEILHEMRKQDKALGARAKYSRKTVSINTRTAAKSQRGIKQ